MLARHRDILASEIAWAPGLEPGIQYARFLLDETNPSSPMIVLSRFDPNSTVVSHTHDTNYFEYIIEGEQTVGKTKFGVGDVRLVTAGTGYGPIQVGPQGCTVLIVFEKASNAMTIPLPRKTPTQVQAS
jgi:anti-sigma factor ChrR (cupin superfamily)